MVGTCLPKGLKIRNETNFDLARFMVGHIQLTCLRLEESARTEESHMSNLVIRPERDEYEH